jgi:transposase-like protein
MAKKTKRMHRSRAFWVDVVAEFKGSGMTQADFARDIKVNATTLNNWIKRLEREKTGVAVTPQFIEVVSAPKVPAVNVNGTDLQVMTRLLVGDVALEFSALPPVTYVSQLLREVSRC